MISIHRLALLGVLIVGAALPAAAQTRVLPQAMAGVARPGDRQRDDRQIGNISPLKRIESRVQNRVQTRLYTRVDRNYDPAASVASPFAVAQEENQTNRVVAPR